MTHSEPEDTGQRLDNLVESLGEKSWRARQRAVDRLSEEGSEESIRRVLEVFRHEHQDLSRLNAAIQVLETTQADVVPALLAFLSDQDTDLRCYAVLTLGERSDPRAIPGLIAAVSDSQTNVRVHAIEALGKLQAAAAVDDLIELAEALDFDVAFPAIDALRKIADGRVAHRLVPLLQQPWLQAVTIEALGALADEDLVPTLMQLLGDPTAPTAAVAQAICRIHDRLGERYGRGSAVEELIRQTGNSACTENVLSAISSASESEAESLIALLGWLPGDEANIGLVELLDNPQRFGPSIGALAHRGNSPLPRLLKRLERLGVQSEPTFIGLFGRLGDERSVPGLLQLLQSEDEEIVTAAIEAMRRIGDIRLYDRAKEMLGHPSGQVRDAAIVAFKVLSSSHKAADLRKLLGDPSPLVRESSVRIISSPVASEYLELLLDRCADTDERVRRAAIERLPVTDDERVSNCLAQAIRTDTPQVRAAAASALGELAHPQIRELLESALADDDVWVRYFTVRSLSRVDLERTAFENLKGAATSDVAVQVRIAATEALGQYGAKSLSTLVELATASITDLARAAVSALGALRIPEAIPALVAATKSQNPDLPAAAIRALAASGQPQAVAPIAAAAMCSDPALAAEAIAALGQIHSASSVEALLEIASFPKKRQAAVAALGEIAHDQIGYLASRLPTLALDARRIAIQVLGRRRSQEAIDVLETALEDPEPAVRYAAFSALGHVRRANQPVPTSADGEGVG